MTTTRDPSTAAGEGFVARCALRFTAFSERWLPDAFGFVLVGTMLVLILGLATGEPLLKAAADPDAPAAMGMIDAWGAGFWVLIEFTLQMAMIVIGGYAVASSAPVSRLIGWLATVPKTPRSAIAFVAAVSMIASYLNWAFSLIFAAFLAREVARRLPRTDYRALGAMAFLGLGTVWAQGLSGSAALQVASADSSPVPVQDQIRKYGFADGVLPLTETIFTWRAIVATLIIFTVAVCTAWLLAPHADHVKTAADVGVDLDARTDRRDEREGATRPGDWIENSPLFTVLIVAIGVVWLARHFDAAGVFAGLDLNTVNMILLLLALLLHWRPWRMVRAVFEGSSAASGVLLQFPFYGGIFGMIAFTGLSARIAGWLVQASNQFFYPPLIAAYSCLLGVFVPSGGSKWVIEAPYVLDAGHRLGVDPGWLVVVYDLGEASANLLQPFWMLPTLAILGLKPRDVMGYTFAMFLVCFPVAVVTVTLLAPHVG
jgi:short-chain fatty acids transporter